MERRAIGAVLVGAIALLAAACGGDTATTGVRASAAKTTTSTTAPTTTTAAVDTTLPLPTTTQPVVTTTRRLPDVTVPPITVPSITVPDLTTTTTEPLPVPELFDVVQGIGTPCAKTDQRPDGCFLFVYTTIATRGWTHEISSDAATSTWMARDHGLDCGDEAQPHHRERDGCSFYLGPVHGRTAGQQECFWATTVAGARRSERSNVVCLTWTDHAAGTEPAGSASSSGAMVLTSGRAG